MNIVNIGTNIGIPITLEVEVGGAIVRKTIYIKGDNIVLTCENETKALIAGDTVTVKFPVFFYAS